MTSSNSFESSDKTAPPRLSIKIPRNFKRNSTSTVSFKETDLMSPRTTTISHPSSSLELSKEVPRAALLLSENSPPPPTSDFTGVSDFIEPLRDEQNLRNLVEDSILGLKALAASAVASLPETPSDRVSSPPESPELNEIEFLGKLFNSKIEDEEISTIYSENCSETFSEAAKKKLIEIIGRADNLLSSNGIAMSLKNVLPLYLKKLIEQESLRIGKKDLTGLLMNENFISASATVILLIPRLVSCIVSVEKVSEALNSNLFDVLLAIENVLKVIPELVKMEEVQSRMKQLQQVLLESLVWKVKNGESDLYKLLRSEFKSIEWENENFCSVSILKTLSGVRSVNKALETLSGFPSIGSRTTRLEIFFRKYLRLAAQRLQFATLRLGLSSSVTQLAWEFFFDLVQSEGINESREIFKNRHLNQILLAIIYCCAGLLEEERSLQQIYQVLPNSQNNNTWLSKEGGDTCDFYTFYNEIFVPPLKKRIETFLNRFEDEGKDDKWILNELFTTAPFPLNPLHQIAANITLNRLNQPKPRIQAHSTTKYEWMSPFPSAQASTDQQKIPQTPSNTSQLFNIPISLYSATEQHDYHKRRPPTDETDASKEFRLKKIARRLDFSEES